MIKPLTYIIADDDDIYRELTLQQLEMFPNLQCLAFCSSAFEVNSKLQQFTPDLLILDVEMPGLTGIQLAKSLKNLPLIIFITSHPTYAAEAFEVDAIDYLVKPAPPERLLRAIDKARMLLEMKNSINSIDGFKSGGDDSFFIKDKTAYVKIFFSNVLYIESLGDFVNIYLQQGEKRIALVSLKNLEQQLPASDFVRISRTHMVNKQKISAIETNQVLLNNIQLPIGKTYTDQVHQSVIGNNAIKRFL